MESTWFRVLLRLQKNRSGHMGIESTGKPTKNRSKFMMPPPPSCCLRVSDCILARVACFGLFLLFLPGAGSHSPQQCPKLALATRIPSSWQSSAVLQYPCSFLSHEQILFFVSVCVFWSCGAEDCRRLEKGWSRLKERARCT